MYLNLDSADSAAAHTSAWVVTSFTTAGGRFGFDVDAAALGNGCSARAPESELLTGTAVIGPRP